MSSRRQFVSAIGAAALAAAPGGGIPRRKLGKTGLEVSVLGLGGAPAGNLPTDEEAVRLIRRCYEAGVTYFDTASAGAYGVSQKRYGLALKDVRQKVVLATKTRNRTFSQAQLDLDQSLANLRTDSIDLYQVHNVMNEEDIEFIFGPRGVMEMIEKAKKAGKIRHVGFTGHTDPAILNNMMARYEFATVLLPLSVTDGGNRQKSFERETVPLAVKRGMGIVAMKTLGAGKILADGAAKVEECLNYVWSLPVATAILGCSEIAQVDLNARLARTAKKLSAAEMDALRRRAAGWELARLEPWKGSTPTALVYRAD